MAKTKAELQTLITTNLPSNGNIQAVKHREVEQEIVNNIYGETFTMSGTGTWEYQLTLIKKGDLVYIRGFITNTLFSTRQANTLIATIASPLFYAGGETILTCVTLQNKATTLRINGGAIYVNSSVDTFNTIYINGYYKYTE